ncbi:MAG: hypothetical protein IJF47_00970 [Candidatus Methanomethylophilaceae archaeon]|nr:hypothetical protein [Candidatus Methanomethylophilaceae archaeon]
MVRLRDATAIAIAMIILFSAVPMVFTDSSDAAVKNDGVLFYEVYVGDEKGFSLKNYGTSAVNIGGWTYSDGEGTITIKSGLSIAPGGIIAFVNEKTDSWLCDTTDGRKVMTDDEQTGKKGSYNINSENGDDLYLYNISSVLVDAIGFGKKSPSEGWTGNPAYLNSLNGIKRVESTDSNTQFDWTVYGEDLTALPYDGTESVQANVRPFVFPDSGGRFVLESLMGATKSVQVSIYFIQSHYVVGVLTDLAKKGVEVEVILEGAALGVKNPVELFRNITEAGGSVKYINFSDNSNYYVHNKYAIIDNDEVIITSENWTIDNMSKDDGNRGWGAIIYGAAFAEKMSVFFENDFHGKYVIDLEEKAKEDNASSKTTQLDYSWEKTEEYCSSIKCPDTVYRNVPVSIYMSPDNTYKALLDKISKAQNRVYSEQMDVGDAWQDLSAESPLKALIDASNRGLDVRFLLDGHTDLVDDINENTNVKAASVKKSGYGTMHNKGVIIDDSVWVSSVNWTSNSFLNNRECGLFIESADVTNFYLGEFMEDWNVSYSSNDIEIEYSAEGEGATFTADIEGPVEWTVEYTDGSKEVMSEISSTLVLESTENVKSVTVTGGEDGYGKFYVAQPEPEPENGGLEDVEIPEGAGFIAIIVAIIAVIFGIIKKIMK